MLITVKILSTTYSRIDIHLNLNFPSSFIIARNWESFVIKSIVGKGVCLLKLAEKSNQRFYLSLIRVTSDCHFPFLKAKTKFNFLKLVCIFLSFMFMIIIKFWFHLNHFGNIYLQTSIYRLVKRSNWIVWPCENTKEVADTLRAPLTGLVRCETFHHSQTRDGLSQFSDKLSLQRAPVTYQSGVRRPNDKQPIAGECC